MPPLNSPALRIVDRVQKAWSPIEAPPDEAMQYFIKGWGQTEKDIFLGVKPVDVDREASGFLIADVLAEMSPLATAAYLGPYLIAFFEDLAFQEDLGFCTEAMVRASVLSLLTLPGTWPDILQPHLSRACKDAVDEAVNYILKSKQLMKLESGDVQSLEKLVRLIAEDSPRG